MSNCIKKIIFQIKLLKTGLLANDKWRQVPGFELLRHIYVEGQISIKYVQLFLPYNYFQNRSKW